MQSPPPPMIVTLDDPAGSAGRAGVVHEARFAGAERAAVLAGAAWAIWNGASVVRSDDPVAIDRIARTVAALRDARMEASR
jgi:hypothetical protein